MLLPTKNVQVIFNYCTNNKDFSSFFLYYINFDPFIYIYLFFIPEIECRTPDEVRYIIRIQSYENLANKMFINMFIIFCVQLAILNI